MRKGYWVAGSAAVLMGTIAAVAWAATIENLNGQSCGASAGDWHFVNNQTRGAPRGTITAMWDTGEMCVINANKVNSNNQHFDCDGFSGELVSASTTLPGRLVLSNFTCGKEPPCDPKDPKCEPPK